MVITFNLFSKKTAIVVGALLMAFVLGAVGMRVYASIPSQSDGRIHGCVSNQNGNLKLIDFEAGQTCNQTKETAVDWPTNLSTGGGGGGGGDSNSAFLFFNQAPAGSPGGTLPTVNMAYSKNVDPNMHIIVSPDNEEGAPADSRNYQVCVKVSFLPKWSDGATVKGNPSGTPTQEQRVNSECGQYGSQYNAFMEFESTPARLHLIRSAFWN